MTQYSDNTPDKHQDNHQDNHQNKSANVVSENTPWFIQLLSGISGLIAGIMLVLFIFVTLLVGLQDSAFFGIVMTVASITLFYSKKIKQSDFLLSFAFSISVAGQIFIAIGLLDIASEYNDFLFIRIIFFMLFQVLLAMVIPNFLHRLGNIFVALSSFVWLLSELDVPELAPFFIALIAVTFNLLPSKLIVSLSSKLIGYTKVTKYKAQWTQLIKATAYASAILLLNVAGYVRIFVFDINEEMGYLGLDDSYNYFIAQSMIILVCVYAVYLILKRYRIALLTRVGLVITVAVIALGLVSVFITGLLSTILVIVIAFANRQRTLVILGITALVSYVIWYYYQLDTNLLIKSASALAVGIVLLLTRWFINRQYFNQPLFLSFIKPVTLTTLPKHDQQHNQQDSQQNSQHAHQKRNQLDKQVLQEGR